FKDALTALGGGAAAYLFPNGLQGGVNPGFAQGAQAAQSATPPALPPGRAEPPANGAASPSINANLEAQIVDFVQMTPGQAADWLRSQPPPADQLIDALVKTPDERIPELIPQIRPYAPRGANLLAARVDWLIRVAQRLRQAAYNAQNPTVGESPL